MPLHPASPCTSSMHTRRVWVGAAAARAFALHPAGTIASRNGRATVAPAPRRNVLRAMCLPVRYDIASVSLEGLLRQTDYGARCLVLTYRRSCIRHRFGPAHTERVTLHNAQDQLRDRIP